MKKLVSLGFAVALLVVFLSCASTPGGDYDVYAAVQEISGDTPSGDPNAFIERSLADIVSHNFSRSEGFRTGSLRHQRNERIVYRFVTHAHIHIENSRSINSPITISDAYGNRHGVTISNAFNRTYELRRNPDLDPQKLYRVYLQVITERRVSSTTQDVITSITIERIAGLLTYREASQRERDERQRIAQEAADQRRGEIEAAFQEALDSGDADTILRFLRSGFNSRDVGFDRARDLRSEGVLEAARLITGNSNIEVGDFSKSFINSRINPINPYAFDETKIYYLHQVWPQQFIEGRIIALVVQGTPNATILLQNVPNIQTVGGRIDDLFMRYIGVTTLRLAGGGIREVATFNVVYRYQR